MVHTAFPVLEGLGRCLPGQGRPVRGHLNVSLKFEGRVSIFQAGVKLVGEGGTIAHLARDDTQKI